jgi:3D (Asp-Asp-Asp) domain-containing protein
MKTRLILLAWLTLISAHGAGLTFTVTAYCPCVKCCGPQAAGLTASGARARVGVTVAAPRRIPFGTRLRLPGIGTRIVQDRLARRYDSRLDVFVATHAEAVRFGVRRLTLQ